MSLPMSLSMPRPMPMPNGPCSGGPADLFGDYVSSAVPRPASQAVQGEGSQSIHFRCTLYPVSYQVPCIM